MTWRAISSRPYKKEFHNSMDNLNAFLREKNLKVTDKELCTRLRQYYLFKQYHGANDTAGWEDVLVKVGYSFACVFQGRLTVNDVVWLDG